MKHSQSYRNRIFDNYLSTTMLLQRKYTRESYDKQCVMFRKYFGRFLPASKHASILDLGCGGGEFLFFLKKEGYQNCEGVDISAEMIEKAQAMGIENLVVADSISYLRDHPGKYDIITAHDLIEHLEKDQILVFLDAISQALKESGYLILSTANTEGPFGARHAFGDFTHETAFTSNSLTQVLKVAGFRHVRCYPKAPYVHGMKSTIRWILWQLIERAIRLYMLVETGNVGSGIYTQTMFAVARKGDEQETR